MLAAEGGTATLGEMTASPTTPQSCKQSLRLPAKALATFQQVRTEAICLGSWSYAGHTP